MPAAKPTFAGRYELRTFGNKYRVAYDTIVDHDTYDHLRVSYEVDRGEQNKTTLCLNGKPIGEIFVVRDPATNKILGYHPERLAGNALPPVPKDLIFKDIGKAGAALITMYVDTP